MASREEKARSFGTHAAAYERGRPEYPREAVEWMLSPLGPAPRVIDVGAGTGKLTRVVAEVISGSGGEVIAVEPDAAMLDRLRHVVPDVETLIGSAEQMALPDGSADAAVFGQSWHWVSPPEASRELGRVIRPGGVLGLVWNIRDESVEWVAKLSEIMHHSEAEHYVAEQLDGSGSLGVGEPFGELETRSWRWACAMTREELFDMVHSRSYVITAAPAERERIDAELSMLFDEIGAVGQASVEFPYLTQAFRARRAR